MDEVTDPNLSVTVEGLFGGLILYILNKIKDTKYGEKNTTLVPNFARIKRTNPEIWLVEKKYKKIKHEVFNSTRSFHTKIRASNRIGPHNEDVLSLIIGSLLGDCYGNRRSVEGTRFAFKQSAIHKEYLFWIYNFLFSRGYCSNLEPRKYTRYLKNSANKEYFGYEFNTFTFRSFNWVYDLFYVKGKKIIKPELENYLTPLALAVWVMDDGGWAEPGVRISTYSFTLEEVNFLALLLKKLFDLNCTIQVLKNGTQAAIYIKKESVPKLRSIILPYMYKSMHYKLGIII